MIKKDRILMLPSDELFPIIEEYLSNGQDVVIRVRGNSMFPLMRSNIDNIKIMPAEFVRIKKRDIVLIKRDSGAYVIHRVCKKTQNAFYMVGDNQQNVEGPLRPDQLIAVAEEVYRGKRTIRRGSLTWNLYACVWLMLRPVRKPLLAALVRMYSAVRRKR